MGECVHLRIYACTYAYGHSYAVNAVGWTGQCCTAFTGFQRNTARSIATSERSNACPPSRSPLVAHVARSLLPCGPRSRAAASPLLWRSRSRQAPLSALPSVVLRPSATRCLARGDMLPTPPRRWTPTRLRDASPPCQAKKERGDRLPPLGPLLSPAQSRSRARSARRGPRSLAASLATPPTCLLTSGTLPITSHWWKGAWAPSSGSCGPPEWGRTTELSPTATLPSS